MIVVRRIHNCPRDKPPLGQLSEVYPRPLHVLLVLALVLVREAAANSFPCFVRKTSARDEVRWFVSFGTSCFADDMQVFQVPLAPRTNP